MDELAHRRPGPRPGRTAEPLWREVLGARLRRLRKRRRLTLTELAERAGLSPQYLSEIERGRKEPSSEMIAAITGALGITLIELTAQVGDEMQRDTLALIDLARSSSAAAHPAPRASAGLCPSSSPPSTVGSVRLSPAA